MPVLLHGVLITGPYQKGGGGSQILDWMYARGGGGHADAYCVQQGGWGGVKIGKNCVRN